MQARRQARQRDERGRSIRRSAECRASKIHTVLNGTDWYDDDTSPAPAQWNSPPPTRQVGSWRTPMTILDVKATEDNSFPLASLIPLFPDIKRKARRPDRGGRSA